MNSIENGNVESHSQDFELESCSSQQGASDEDLGYFDKFASLGNHSTPRQNHKEKKFKCSECGKYFSRAKKLMKHLQRHLKDEASIGSHKECCRKTNRSARLQTHYAEVDSFRCSVCRKRFRKRSHLKIHLEEHIKKIYKCTVCLKRFKEDGNLRLHLQKHIDAAIQSGCAISDGDASH